MKKSVTMSLDEYEDFEKNFAAEEKRIIEERKKFERLKKELENNDKFIVKSKYYDFMVGTTEEYIVKDGFCSLLYSIPMKEIRKIRKKGKENARRNKTK